MRCHRGGVRMSVLGEKGRTGELLLRQKQCQGKGDCENWGVSAQSCCSPSTTWNRSRFRHSCLGARLRLSGVREAQTFNKYPATSSVLVLNLVCSLILGLIYLISVLPLTVSGILTRVKQDKSDGLRVLIKDHCLWKNKSRLWTCVPDLK